MSDQEKWEIIYYDNGISCGESFDNNIDATKRVAELIANGCTLIYFGEA